MRIFESIARYLESDRFFPGWTREALEDYVAFHMQQSTICIAVRGHAVTGVLVGWQQCEPRHIPFNWQRTDPKGMWWWWDQYKADDHESALTVGRAFVASQPICLGLPSVGMRHGKIKIYQPGMALRAYQKGMQIYGHVSSSTR